MYDCVIIQHRIQFLSHAYRKRLHFRLVKCVYYSPTFSVFKRSTPPNQSQTKSQSRSLCSYLYAKHSPFEKMGATWSKRIKRKQIVKIFRGRRWIERKSLLGAFKYYIIRYTIYVYVEYKYNGKWWRWTIRSE